MSKKKGKNYVSKFYFLTAFIGLQMSFLIDMPGQKEFACRACKFGKYKEKT